MDKKKRIEELVKLLNEASHAYYSGLDDIMTNFEWDEKLDELSMLEDETGYIMPDSPTQNVSAGNMDNNREPHEFPALSLKKDKSVDALKKWAGSRSVWLSWKLDGITLVATYDNGKLSKLMTRGNGIIGKNITFLSPYINGLPEKIGDKGHFVVRGEAVISYSHFEYINDVMGEGNEYKNPRNLVSGTLDLDEDRAEDVKQREVRFIPFTLVYCEKEIISWGDRMDYLGELGFNPVDRENTDAEHMQETIDKWTEKVEKFDYPVDGLVITYDDTVYASQGTVTGHHANNAGMAFKWQDEKAETVLDHVEWSCAASVISPVAVFKPVQLEGTQVHRASLCNISEMKRLGIGANGLTTLGVIKANKIIPKCISADAHGTEFEIPKTCPVCGMPTEVNISEKTGTETLRCTNQKCTAKHISKFTRFVSRDGLDIDGLSMRTIMAFINNGFIKEFNDIFDIAKHKDAIVYMDGFGGKSYSNLINAIEKSKKAKFSNFLYALCIPMIGTDAVKKILGTIGSDGFKKRIISMQGFEDIEGIGTARSNSIIEWFKDGENMKVYQSLMSILSLEPTAPTVKSGVCSGMTFVVTGSLHTYKNRDELVSYIESQGGKVSGSVSKNTDFLINNDAESDSSKNKKAKSLGIPILTEDEFNETASCAGFKEKKNCKS